ncbi:unnamed protein product [Trypanosoma congolense IL3000]|uniref:WGS project CAEQ00000000 data, annotated contig 1752 n=1 Tax=Trypanosoma congolense (strain IL3000) TaxID=1068625 RepID=F9W8N3_TRYCI|nr:unnamed protein product [Trypanosoma congolense IL3000]
MKKVSMYAGFSMCATLFTKELPLCEATGVYYTVKKANEEIPLAVIPVEVKNSGNDSCIVLMIRKRKGCTETAWELVRLGESLAQQDVKSIVKALQSRGLVDPPNYTFDLSRRLDDIFTDNGSDSADSLEEPDDHEISREWKKSVTGDVLLESLCNKPRVKREGRRQYSVGRSAVNLFVAEGDSSDDDEVMEDALRAVVPKYTDSSPVRYDEKTYNIGSCSDQLTQHYVSHREEYGLMAFEADSSGQLVLPSVAGSLTMDKRRMSLGETGFIRPAVPPELSSTFPFLCRRRVISRSKGGHTRGRSPKKRRKCKSRRRKGRRSKGRRSASRSSSCGSNKVKDS